jgi:hypothetical protein
VSFLRSLSKKSTQAYSILFFSTLFLVLHQYVKDRFFSMYSPHSSPSAPLGFLPKAGAKINHLIPQFQTFFKRFCKSFFPL